MLYIFSGEANQYREFIESLKQKGNFSSVYFSSASELPLGFIDEMSQETLFGETYLAAIDGFSKAVEFANVFLSRVETLKTSSHTIVVFDEEEALVEFAQEHKVLIAPKTTAKAFNREVNPFTISDSIFTRDKKNAWLTFHSLLSQGLEIREIHSVLFWAFKAIAQSTNAKTAEDAGVKPFVFGKAKRGGWKKEEVGNALFTLSAILHTTSFDEEDFSFAIERFILKAI